MKKIIVVDDQNDVLEVIKDLLVDAGHSVTTSSNPASVINMLERENYDLVITDMVMPELSGIELTRSILKKFPSIKVLACSGGGTEGSKLVASLVLDHAIEEGVHRTILKPFSSDELLQKVKILIGQ